MLENQAVFDPIKYKEATRDEWNTSADSWYYWGSFLHQWLGPCTETMFDMIGLQNGQHVLDVAAGAGEQSVWAAKRVGANGKVLATDISPRILEFAERSAKNAGLHNIQTQVMDGEELDVPENSFDAVICRVGLIFFPDQKKALQRMMRALKPGGKIGAIVYTTAEHNKFFSVPMAVIRKRAKLPTPLPGQPGPFSLGDPGSLESILKDAGFDDIKIKTVPAPVHMESATDCLRFEKESFGALHMMMGGLSTKDREKVWREIHSELAKFERPGKGFNGPCELRVGVGTKAS